MEAEAEAIMALDFDALALDQPTLAASGTPLLLPIDAIDEDPAQPRLEFDAEALQQLADTIAERGVRQPVSVRTHPGQPGRWMLNFGARRLRASHLAGKTAIPAFVDEAADSYDQVIENEQREGLKPLELALFVQRRLLAGDRQADIARRLGKSRTYVMYATALIDAPDWLLNAYRDGRCRGSRELHELRGLHAEHPKPVEDWMETAEVISRDRIAALRVGLSVPATATQPPAAKAIVAIDPTRASTPLPAWLNGDASRAPRKCAGVTCLVLLADLDGQGVEVVLDAMPARDGDVHVRRITGGEMLDVAAARLTLLRVVAR